MPFGPGEPRTWLRPGQTWPDGTLKPDAPDTVIIVQHITRTITATYSGTIRELARNAGLQPSIISRILNGETIPDIRTIAALEKTLNVNLWPAGWFRAARR